MTLPMNRRLLTPLAALVVGGAAGCVDLTEKPITQITSAYYATPSGFEAAVNAMYTPMRTFWPDQRGATFTVFGTDEYTKGADGSYKYFNDYTAQLKADALKEKLRETEKLRQARREAVLDERMSDEVMSRWRMASHAEEQLA